MSTQVMDYLSFVESMKLDPKEILASLTPWSVDVLHMGLGLAGEVEELFEAFENNDKANMEKEAGDCLYYLTGIRMDLPESQSTIDGAYYHPLKISGRISEMLKKVCIQQKIERVSNLCYWVDQADTFIKYVLNEIGSTTEEIMDLNMEKLTGRHPNGFDKSR